MDKYDEKAQAMIGHYPPSLPAPCPEECRRCERVAFTAHAMREAAMQAFEEAGDWIVKDGIGFITVGEVRESLYRRAASLRAAALAPEKPGEDLR